MTRLKGGSLTFLRRRQFIILFSDLFNPRVAGGIRLERSQPALRLLGRRISFLGFVARFAPHSGAITLLAVIIESNVAKNERSDKECDCEPKSGF